MESNGFFMFLFRFRQSDWNKWKQKISVKKVSKQFFYVDRDVISNLGRAYVWSPIVTIKRKLNDRKTVP